MRIAHIVSTFPPYQGGMGNVCLAQVKELVNIGHQVSVFVPGNPDKSGERDGFSVKYVKPWFKCGNAAFVPSIAGELKGFDLVHLHWPFLGGAEIFLFRHLFRKKPLVVQYHMDLIAPGIRGLIFKLNSFLFNPLFIKRADRILVSSLDYLKHSNIKRHWLKNKDKFVVSPFGVCRKNFYPREKDRELLNRYGLNEKHQIILSVGALDKAHYFKGAGLLIRAMAGLKHKMPGLRLILVGEGDLKSEYERLAEDLKVKENIIFIGKVENGKLPDYYNLASVFVFPSISRSEAFGLVSLEAMACAKPLIVSNLPGPRALVENNGLIVKVNDLGDLKEKISFIFNNEARLKEFGENSLNLVKEKYNWSAIVKKIEKIYVQAVGL